MALPPAYSVWRDFPAEPPKTMVFDRHYFLFAERGLMRLEDEGRVWTLPPARAAWIAAGVPLTLTNPRGIRAASALFDPEEFPAPGHPLRVFEMTPLARSLIDAVRPYGPDERWDSLAPHLFRALAEVAERLASGAAESWRPAGGSAPVRQALTLTEETLEEGLTFEEIAARVGRSPRALARDFAADCGMSWSAARQRIRVTSAMALLAGEAPPQIAQVALQVGYQSLSAFNAAFRAQTGQSPRQFRASLSPKEKGPPDGQPRSEDPYP